MASPADSCIETVETVPSARQGSAAHGGSRGQELSSAPRRLNGESAPSQVAPGPEPRSWKIPISLKLRSSNGSSR